MKFLTAVLFAAFSTVVSALAAPPNIVFIFVDDCGWRDFSCYGNPVLDTAGQPITPNIDRLAADGIRFTNGYVASPICSPSRVGVLTGTEPCRHGIHSFLDTKAANRGRNMNDWLQPDTVTSARIFRDAGYATGQFGKWHMGGGRDVNDAPTPQAYGFEKSLTSFEGMGDRVLFTGHGLSEANADVPGTITWAKWEEGAGLHTDAAISFIQQAASDHKPFYIHVPYDDTHSPYNVAEGHEDDFAHITTDPQAKLFLGELNALDKQIGRLIDTIDGLGLAENTLIVLVGDNGAPNDDVETILNRNGGLRSGKGNIYEGGIRVPFIVRMPGKVPQGIVNNTTAVSTLDLLPTYCSLAGITPPDAPYAGENILDVFTGSDRARKTPLFWEFGTVSNQSPASPKLAVRRGDLKFLRDPDGGRRELYDLGADRRETNNLVADPAYAAAVTSFEGELMRWYQEAVLGEVGEIYTRSSSPAGVLVADSFDVPTGNSTGSGFGAGTGVNTGVAQRQTGLIAQNLSYVQTDTARAASSHSISGNALAISAVAGSTAFQLSADGTTPLDLGKELRGRKYEARITLDLDDTVASHARASFGIADSSSPPGGVGGHDLCVQLDLVTGNTISVFKRMDVGSYAGAADFNAAIRTDLPPGQPVDFRLVLQDSTDYTGLNTTYQIFINGTLADSGNITFSSDSRYFIFDTAGGVGPMRYENFAIERLDEGTPVPHRLPIVRLSEIKPAATPGKKDVRLFWTARPAEENEILISQDLKQWTPYAPAGTPLVITSGQGTNTWLDLEVPEDSGTGTFFRLKPVN
jgi:arylsulfatase A-like enzyme